MPCTFKDADKKASDLLKKGFVDGQKFTTKIKTNTGVEFTTESAKKTHDEKSFASKLAAKFKASSGFNVDKFEIDSSGKNGPKMTSEVSLNEPSWPGAKFSLKTVICNALDWEDETAEIGVEYSDNTFLYSGKVDPVNRTGSFNFVGAAEGFMAGFEGKAKCLDKANDSCMFSKLGLACKSSLFLGYEGNDFSIVARSTEVGKGKTKYQACKLSAFHKYSSALSLGTIATINYDNLKKEGKKEEAVSITAAGKYSIDGDTSMVFSLTDKAILKMGYSQKLFPKLKATGSASVDLKAKTGKVNAPLNFGVQFDFGDI